MSNDGDEQFWANITGLEDVTSADLEFEHVYLEDPDAAFTKFLSDAISRDLSVPNQVAGGMQDHSANAGYLVNAPPHNSASWQPQAVSSNLSTTSATGNEQLSSSMPNPPQDAQGSLERGAGPRLSSQSVSESTHEDQRETPKGAEDLEGIENRDPFAAAEAWMQENDEKLIDMEIEGDDLGEMKQPKNTVEVAKRILESLLEPYQEAKAEWSEPVKSQYVKQQNNATAKVQTALSAELGDKRTLALCLRLVRNILRLHSDGMLKIHDVKSKKELPVGTYITETEWKCSERCERVIEAVRSNKLIALDIIRYDTDQMVNFALAPTQYLKRKLQNTGCNNRKALTTSKGKRVEEDEKAAEMAALRQDTEDPSIGNKSSSAATPSASSTPKAKRGGRAGTQKPTSATKENTPQPKVPKRTIADFVADNEDSSLADQGANKRSKSSPEAAVRKPGRRGAGRPRKQVPENFPSVDSENDSVSAGLLNDTRSNSEAVRGATSTAQDELMLNSGPSGWYEHRSPATKPALSFNDANFNFFDHDVRGSADDQGQAD